MDNSPALPLTWGFQPLLVAVAGLAAALAAVLGLLLRGSEDRLVAWVAAAVLALAALAAWSMRRRLEIDPNGFVVRGPLGARRYRWSQVSSIAAPTRRRRGLTSVSVEIELLDDSLIVLGRLELGTDPAAVAATLLACRAGADQPPRTGH